MSDVAVGTTLPPQTFRVTRFDLVRYAGASGDFNLIHWNERFAKAVGLPVTLEELAAEPFLLREDGSGSRHVVDEHRVIHAYRDIGVEYADMREERLASQSVIYYTLNLYGVSDGGQQHHDLD